MIKRLQRIVAIALMIAIMMQVSHLENYRYIGEVFATSAKDDADKQQEETSEIQEKSETKQSTEIQEEPRSEQKSAEEENTQQQTTDTEQTTAESAATVITEAPVSTTTTVTEAAQDYDFVSMYTWQEMYVESGIIESDVELNNEPYKLMSDITIKGDLTIKSPLNLNGYSLVVEGDVNLFAISVINGSMTVQGNYNYQAGVLSFESGRLDVNGNFQIANTALNSMQMIMENSTDYLCVAGDFILDNESVAYTEITSGTIELKGDFIQETTLSVGKIQYPEGDFVMSGDSVLLLSGTEPQNIYIAKETTKLSQIIIDTANVEKDENDQYVFNNRRIGFSGLCTYEEYIDNGCPTTYGYMKYNEITADCQTIYGSCYYVGEPLHLVGNTLTVFGDFIQDAGLHTEGGSLYVTGDYRIQSWDEDETYGATEGYVDTSDCLLMHVYGTFYTQSVVDHTELLTDGYWYISDGLYQIGEDVKNFTTTGTTQVTLGSYTKLEEVHVWMDNPLGNEIIYLYPGGSNVKFSFDNGAYLKNYFGLEYSGFLYYNSGCSSYGGNVLIFPDVTQLTSLDATGNVTIQGDLKITNRIKTTGNVIVENGDIELVYAYISASTIYFAENSQSSLSLDGNISYIKCTNFVYGGSGDVLLNTLTSSITCTNFNYMSNSTLTMNGSSSYITCDNFTSNGSIVINGEWSKITCKKLDITDIGSVFMNGELCNINCTDFTITGNGSLSMIGEDCVISCDNFYYACNSENENLTNGRINITGDFFVKDTGIPNSFVCSENHVVYANGSNRVQHITIENPGSCIETLQVCNGAGGITVATPGTLIHNIINSSKTYEWEGIEGFTLEEDMVYSEDLVLYGGTLNLNGYTLTVNGDFVAYAGIVNINGGHLIINGDMNLAYRDNTATEMEFYHSYADIVMDQEDDRINIAGDWYCKFNNRSLPNMTNGTVTLQGDMNIDGYVSTYGDYEFNIMSGTNLHLIGAEKQTITGVSTKIKVGCGDLIVENESEIVSELPVTVSGALQLPENLTYSFYSMNMQDLGKLSSGKYIGDITANASTLTKDVQVEGALIIAGNTDLCGYTLGADKITINKPITLSKGAMKASTIYMYDKVYMLQPEDVIEADYLYVKLTTTDNDYMTDGNIYITEAFYDRTLAAYAFLPTGNHTITFNKTDISSEDLIEIHFTNSTSLLNCVILSATLRNYDLSRERDEIAKEVRMGYEDTELPATPQNVSSTAIGCFHVNLTWDEATDNVEVYKYKIYRDGKYLTRISGTSYTDAILNPNTTYRYTISVIDAKGNESEQSQVLEVTTTQDTEKPYFKNYPAITTNENYLKMELKNVFKDADGYVDYYIITKNGEEVARLLENASIKYTNVENKTKTHSIRTASPVYEENELEYGVTYEYGITAVDSEGNVSEEYVIELMPDYPPKQPEDFKVVSENGFNIPSFQMSGTEDVSYYIIYRADLKHYLAKIHNTGEIYSYRDTSVTVGETYTYYVTPYNSYGTEGTPTEKIEMETLAEVTPPTFTSIEYSNPSEYINEDMSVQVEVADESALSSLYAYIVKIEEEEKKEIHRESISFYRTRYSTTYNLSIAGLEGEYELHTVVVDHCGNETEEVKLCKINMGGLSPVEMIDMKASASTIYMEWEPVEGASYYVVERGNNNTFSRVVKTRNTEARMSGLNCDTAYTCRVAAYDENGVRGLSMEPVTITTASDTLAPSITNLYAADSLLAWDTDLMIGYEDDIRVKTIYTYYRKSGETEWNVINENNVNKQSGITYITWDKSGLPSGSYEVRYLVEDTSGNQSQEQIVTYVLDLDSPLIRNFTLTPKDWAIELSWDAFQETDYSRYEIRRITLTKYETAIANGTDPFRNAPIIETGTSKRYFEEQISPHEEYVYQLSTYDQYNNVSTAIVQGTSINNDVIAPDVITLQPMFTAQGVRLGLSATGCSDNEGIAKYEWNMGNGDVIYGLNCEYVYQAPGTYSVSLTVYDYNGNTATSRTSVTVGKDVGYLTVKVMSGSKYLPGADVLVCVNGQATNNGAGCETDSQGSLLLAIPAGTYKIAAYKDGYIPNETEAAIAVGENREVVIQLEKGEMIDYQFETKKMTKEEMEEAGIDTSKNEQVFRYDVTLEYESGDMETITFDSSQDEISYSVPTFGKANQTTTASNVSGTSNITITKVPTETGGAENQIWTITRTIPITISWLQNIYQVDFTIINQAEESFYLEEGEAEIDLSGGLSLAVMKGKNKNEQTWEFDTLQGGESKTHTWYVSGSEAKKYPLQVNMKAILQPFNLEIEKTLVSAEDLDVKVGEGLHLYVYPEQEAYIGETYYVQFRLANESDQDYYNVTAGFGKFETVNAVAKVIAIVNQDGVETSKEISADTGAVYFVKDENIKEAKIDLQTNDKVTVETLKAGESVYGTYKFRFDAPGDINRQYYKLLTEYVDYLNVNNTNVRVTIMPVQGHLKKTVAELKLSSRKTKKKNSQTTSNTTSSGNTSGGNNTNNGNNGNNNGGGNNGNTQITHGNLPSMSDWDKQMPNHTEEVKDPINLMTGAFTTNHVLAAVSGASTFDFGISYNSLYTDVAGDMGKGWYHNYEMRVEREGSMITLHQNPYEVLYFTESDETANRVCGTVEEDVIVLGDDSDLERTYYQMGTTGKTNYIVKNTEGYTLYSNNEKYTFDKEGVLTSYINAEGQKLSITKKEDSLVIADAATGKKITVSYNEEGRIVSVKDAADGETTFEYKKDCMIVLKGKSGTKLIYEYDENGHILVGKEGDETVYVENTFDEKGRVLTQIANGKKDEITKFSYVENEEDETTTVTMTNADGTTEQAVSDKYGQGIQYVDAIGGVKNYTYNAYHEMTAYRYSNGTGADYTYDSNGNISKVVETTGRTTDYTYDSQNRVIRMVCNDGTDVAYTYNENGQVETMKSGNGLSATYTYNENGQVLTETSSLGTIEYTYEKGMLRCLKDYSDNYHYFTYDENGNVVQYIDGAGVVTNYKVNASGRVEEEAVTMEDGTVVATKYSYDEYGNLTSKTDAKNNTTQYVYDEEDRLSKEIRPDGAYYQYSYDQNGNVTKIVCPDGVTTAESVYDAAGNALSLTDTLKSVQKAGYSVGGQLLTMTQANGGEIKYTYYENGLLESQTDANDNTTSLTYDAAGRIRIVTDASGASTTFGYDKDGNLSTIENALGNSITMEYNQYRKVVRQTDANGNVTKYDYDKALNCTKVTDAEGGVTEFAYDARGQITSMTKKGDTKEQDVILSMSYNNLGNVTSLTDGEGNTQRMEYDSLGNVTAVYDAYGTKTESYEYDSLGNCTKVTDAFGNVTTNSYDALGNLVKQLNESTGNAVSYSYIGGKYLATSSDSLDRTASMTYDSMGNVETLTNPNGGVTSYKYDLNNNLTDEIIGEDYHVRYTYNAQNLVASKTNSRGQQTTYSYDSLGRIIKQEDEAGIIEYTYDSNDNVLTITETIGDKVNVITRTYDGLNRVKTYEDARGNKLSYSYDKVGNLTKLTYPNGKEVIYTYNKNCSISSVTDWNKRTTTYSYDKNGRLIETKRPNGTIEKREYDKAGQLTLILDMSGDKVVNRQEYSYDASGNITSVKQLYNGELNFTEVENTEMTYDKNNRLLTYNGEEVKYDKDGNMTYGPLNGVVTTFVFDCRNRLIQAGDTTYEYDAENNRIAVATGTKRTEYVVNSQPELSQVLQSKTIENNNEGSAETTYYYYGKGLLAQENGKGYLTYHFNNVGSTMAVTDKDGNISAKYNYSPYGELIQGEYDENIQFLYNGQFGVITDGNGLYYMRARYYNVDIKRFINQDVLTGTLERISSLNRYSYVEGNPISYLDPFGLAIAVLQEIVSLASVFVSGLSLLALVSPQAALVVNVVLIIIQWTLDVIQLYRYDAAPDKGMKLCEDIVSSILGLVSPYDELQSLYEMFKYMFQNRNGWNLDE